MSVLVILSGSINIFFITHRGATPPGVCHVPGVSVPTLLRPHPRGKWGPSSALRVDSPNGRENRAKRVEQGGGGGGGGGARGGARAGGGKQNSQWGAGAGARRCQVSTPHVAPLPFRRFPF
eukprot:1192467-Prorocentrum_minimum.AAC.2